jgi:glycosyltransferase involved in cell wall biosynthesis
MPTPRDISVIIPFYNREQFIHDAIQSALSQTLEPLEIIIVNDCSRESSREYLDRYKHVCRIIDLPKNVGLAGSRNAGIREARGQFIALLDDDDIWLPEKLAVQRAYMEEHPACPAVTCWVTAFFRDKPDDLWVQFGPNPIRLSQALNEWYWAVPSTLMIRAEALRAVGGFDPRFRECEDRDFMIRFCAAGYSVEGIPQSLVRFRRAGQSSLSGHKLRMYGVHLRIVWIHRALFLRVYGVRGIVNFLLATLRKATEQSRFLNHAFDLWLRVFPLKYSTRSGYQEPIASEHRCHFKPGSSMNKTVTGNRSA